MLVDLREGNPRLSDIHVFGQSKLLGLPQQLPGHRSSVQGVPVVSSCCCLDLPVRSIDRQLEHFNLNPPGELLDCTPRCAIIL